MPLSIISAKPMMALSGVRSSWLMLARNSDLARLALSACGLLVEIALGEIGELLGLRLEGLARLLAGPRPSRSAAARIRRSCSSWRFSAVMSVPTET